MTRKQRRAILIAGGLVMLGIASTLVLNALKTQVTFFMSPSEVLKDLPKPGTRFRLGGLVETGTYHKGTGTISTFRLTDGSKSLPVTYNGILPDLFKEGQGAVTEGELLPDGVFSADTVLAKHDEKYMPREVADALKKSGRWQEQGAKLKVTPGT
ncbi:MAG: cytochrome c maturation protein CcmE [Rhodomicrobium sp.]